tara:strand:- start:13169 stop:13666 length:498 start_codon:yes stop_codon:yes gene_type:complete
MIQKLTSISALIGVVLTIGGGFYTWGQFNTRLDTIENKEFVINETVDLGPINEKISTLEVQILDRMSALEDEWMARDNDSLDTISTDILTAKADSIKGDEKLASVDKEIMQKVSDANAEIYKEFGKMRDLINEINKLVTIVQKENELQTILIEEIKQENSSPLGG